MVEDFLRKEFLGILEIFWNLKFFGSSKDFGSWAIFFGVVERFLCVLKFTFGVEDIFWSYRFFGELEDGR